MKRSKRMFAGNGARAVGTPLALDPRAIGVTFIVDEEESAPVNERCMGASLVRITGPLAQRACGWWWDGYDAIASRFAAALEDAETGTVVLVIDSPGGECAGLFECVRNMRTLASASGKRIVAYVDEAAYSAAYALATVASEVYLPESGGVGSIGVIAELVDIAAMNSRLGINVAVVSAGAHKADGHPDVPISDQALEVCAAVVARFAEQFYASVAESRPLSIEEIAGLEAACLHGTDAVDAGLADGVMGLAELLASLASKSTDAMAAPKQETQAMKRTGLIAAIAALGGPDALSAPLVGASPSEVIAEAAGAYKKTETSEVTEETESTDEETGQTTKTTTTTTTESETSGAAEEEEETEPAEEEETEEDAVTSAKLARPAPSASTTRDVLAAVRRLTGATTLGAQLGALEAMHANAARADKLAAKVARLETSGRKASVEARVDAAIKSRLLTPAQRSWAIATGTKDPAILDGYLANAKPVVGAESVRMPAARTHEQGTTPVVAGVEGLTADEAKIAKQLGIDPQKLAAFKAQGGATPTITH